MSRWGCQITDEGLVEISMAKCVGNLTFISLWGMAGITDAGVVQLVSTPAQGLNILYCAVQNDVVLMNSPCSIKLISFNYLQISKATSLQHLNIGGTFVTDVSLYAIAQNCPNLTVSFRQQLMTNWHIFIFPYICKLLNIIHMFFFGQSIVLWSCRHVTESGLLVLVTQCHKLKSINLWGTRVPATCFTGLLDVSPALQIKPALNLGAHPLLQIA